MNDDINEKIDPFKGTNGTTLVKDFDTITTDPEDIIKEEFQVEEDGDIQVVNELALMDDDPTLQCFTLRVFIVGIVSKLIQYTNHCRIYLYTS